MGAPSVVVHNAVGAAFGSFLDLKPSALERNFRINTMTLLHLGQAFAPAMIEAGEGAFIITGNTSAHRGKPRFAGFALPRPPSEFWLRPWRATSARKASMSPMSPSTP